MALLGAVLVALAGLLPALALITRDSWLVALEPGPADLGTLVMALTAPIAAALAAWLLIAVLVSAADALAARRRTRWPSRRGRLIGRYARAVAPAVLRHGVAALIGVTLLSSPAAAATTGARGDGRQPTVVQTEPAASPGAFSAAWPPVRAEMIAAAQDRFAVQPGYVTSEITADDADDAEAGAVRGWLPAPPEVRGDARSHIAGAGADLDAVAATGWRRRLDDDQLVVRRGDTLWSIAARSLGPGATEAQIAGEWPHWFTANRDVIGSDPDHLRPGQRLSPPNAGARTAHPDSTAAGDQR